jgi:hypothetical protein
MQSGETKVRLCSFQPNQWQNLQLVLDLKRGTVSGVVGAPGSLTTISDRRLSAEWSGVIDCLSLGSGVPAESPLPMLEFDNLGVQESPLPPVSTTSPNIAGGAANFASLSERLQALSGIDGDFELQTSDRPPESPWNPGPNSVVKLSAESQSPFQNIYPQGDLGIHMPNRGEYDGFGLTLTDVKPDAEGRLSVGFDFRCGSDAAGGDGSWRYYLGHGPGHSAAIELFFSGDEFVARSADVKKAVGPLSVGQWYQVQLTLDLNRKSYAGSLASPTSKLELEGELAPGWDGTIDYSFIDSYGHVGGVRPSLDADNFIIGPKALPPLDAPPVQAAEGSREERRGEVAEIRKQLADLHGNTDQAKQELESLLANGPCAMAYGMAEGTPHNARIHLRGEPDQPGDEVPRGFPKILGGGALPEETVGSGRLELAQWITRPNNPLVARVMVNRIWQRHFGQGLVKTPNDFGVRGLPPTHPELLDHLAARFIHGGWSVKSLHREIMLSATYRQAAATTPAAPDLAASFPRRRLSAEEIRDSILAVSGGLDATPGREHPFPSPTGWGFTQHNPFTAVYDHPKRSVYLMTQRIKRHPFLALFDGADPNATTPGRLTTTVPTQALFFLNDPFVHASAEKWAARLTAEQSTDEERIGMAFRQALGRGPTEAEFADGIGFLAAYRAELAATNGDGAAALPAYLRTLLASNEFLFVD